MSTQKGSGKKVSTSRREFLKTAGAGTAAAATWALSR